MINIKGLGWEERVFASLSSLYKSRGYQKYKMGSFEEYSMYLDNKDFLTSQNVITFGGLDGKLLALRPDVTLSIIKNVKTEETSKVFYNEKVYREVLGEYKEVSQTGVEVIGEIDLVTESEITELILHTLDAVGKNYLLDVSHMGFVEGLIDSFNLSQEEKEVLYMLLKTKNTHDLKRFVPKLGESDVEKFSKLLSIGGEPTNALKQAREIAVNEKMLTAVNELSSLVEVMQNLGKAGKIKINFSIANNADYYNGIIYNGYVEGIPHAVLSGGRYDKLLKKFNKNAGALGFALYLGELERYFPEENEQLDAIILYTDDAVSCLKIANEFASSGKSVKLCKTVPNGVKFKKVYKIANGKAEEVQDA